MSDPSASDSDGSADSDETPLQQIAGGFAVGLTLLVAFSLLAVGYPWFWVAFPVGFAGFVPLVVGIARYYEHRETRGPDRRSDETTDALEVLRTRYANGELSDEAFEHRVATLLETENVYAAREYTAGTPIDADVATAADADPSPDEPEGERLSDRAD